MPRLSSHFGLQDPRLQSILFETISPVAITADSNQSLTAAQLLSGWINRSGMTAARTDTTPKASDLVEAIQGAFPGLSFTFRVRNISAGAFAVTLAAGAGCTLAASNNMAAAQNTDHVFRVILNNTNIGSEAYTLYSLGTAGAF